MVAVADSTPRSGVPPGICPAWPVLLDDPCQSAQRFVGFPGTWKYGRYIRLEHNDNAARGVTRRILIGPRAAEVVLRKYFVEFNLTRVSTPDSRSPHNLSIVCRTPRPVHQLHQSVLCYLAMRRATVTIPNELAEAVEAYVRAQEAPSPLTAVVQAALRQYLTERGSLREGTPLVITPARKGSGRHDVSRAHDRYLATR